MAGQGSVESYGDIDSFPGTGLLIRDDGSGERQVPPMIVPSPVPTRDSNEPLNWSTARKAFQFTLVLAVTWLIFTALTIHQIFWQLMVVDLIVTYTQLNQAMSVNFVGLATGCIIFIPLAKRFGRRPVYLVSTGLMLITSFRSAGITSLVKLYITNLLQGLAGSTDEAIVQITIADLFFVHQRGGMNALYMTIMMIGSFLTPMAAGAQATNLGWRWSYRTMGILNTALFLLFLIIHEESKYSSIVNGINPTSGAVDRVQETTSHKPDHGTPLKASNTVQECNSTSHDMDVTIPMDTWRKRLALWTYTSESIWPYYYRPFEVLVTFPAVLCCGLQYACGVMWLTILSSVLSLVFPLPPYEFTPAQVGYMSVGPFIGNLLGSFYGGFLGDWSIRVFSRRNNGYYEPEMRLYILHVPALALCGGLIMFGVTIDRGMHWILPSIAGALFGFGLGTISDACLTLVIDSYVAITGDAFTGVAFLRYSLSIGIPFAITPWMERSGLTNMFIACGFISLVITFTLVAMAMYGKRFRRAISTRYCKMASLQ
ncbi:major facilitator superfamily domain-containing protein [Aspergillus avenaceus]|uniref:Major facilitator superfamily domain-containing protein n=1 Tax=Aspergillus avenaceus TaxID=36643 RepID=A0A5N6U932_ASPAV|nr:major facilitator superfamily domain-containing protein [Aspergillus avenaceus]